MSTTRSSENGDEEKKVSSEDQSISSSIETDFDTLLEKSKNELEQIIHVSPDKAEIDKGRLVLKGHLMTKETLTTFILAGRNAFKVAMALNMLDPPCYEYRIAIIKAGSDAIRVSVAIIRLKKLNFTRLDCQPLLLLNTAEFLKLVDAMLLVINRDGGIYSTKIVPAFKVLINHSTLRLTVDMIMAIYRGQIVAASNSFQLTSLAPDEIAKAIIFLHEHADEMKAKINLDTLVNAGNGAYKLVSIVLTLERADLVVSENLLQKILFVVERFSSEDIINAFIQGQRIKTIIRNISIIQQEFNVDNRHLNAPLLDIILSYCRSSPGSIAADNHLSFIRARRLNMGGQLESIYRELERLFKLSNLTRYALEQCESQNDLHLFSKIFLHQSVNEQLFMLRPDLCLNLIDILENHETIVIEKLLRHVPYATLVDEDVRTRIAEGLECLIYEMDLAVREIDFMAVTMAHEHAREVASALIYLNHHNILDEEKTKIIFKQKDNAIHVARQLVGNAPENAQEDAQENAQENAQEDAQAAAQFGKRKRGRVSDSSMFSLKKHCQQDAAPNHSTLPSSSPK